MFGESFVVESRRLRSAMCGGSIRGRKRKNLHRKRRFGNVNNWYFMRVRSVDNKRRYYADLTLVKCDFWDQKQ
jgi:hypothetical protein